MLIYKAERAREVLRFYRDYVGKISEDLTTLAAFVTAPPLPFIPQDLHGKPIFAIVMRYEGPFEKGQLELKPLRDFTRPDVDLVQPMPYAVLQRCWMMELPRACRIIGSPIIYEN